MVRSLHVVRDSPDQATVDVLTRLLADAKMGRVIGLAFVALLHHHEYEADMVGQALESPLLSRGICRALEDEISQK